VQTPLSLHSITPTPPTEFIVVGEHVRDPFRLLVKDPEGNFYAYLLPDGEPTPVEPGDEWTIEQPEVNEFFD